MTVLQTLSFDVSPSGPNATTTRVGPSIGVTGYITKVICYPVSSGNAIPPGRYFVGVSLNPGPTASPPSARLWTGYASGWPVQSAPNQYVTAGKDYLRLDIASGSNGVSTDLIRATIEVSDKPEGGTFLFYQEPGSGPGEFVDTPLPQPAAGSDYAAITVPAGVRWRFVAERGTLVTSGTAANRNPTVNMQNSGSKMLAASGSIPPQTASLTSYWTFGPELLSNQTLTTYNNVTFAALTLISGDTINFSTLNIQATDQWNAGNIRTEEWAMPQP